MSAVDLAERLIACESVTPARGAVFDVLEDMLAPLGFEVHRFIAGGHVENCLAIRRVVLAAARARRSR